MSIQINIAAAKARLSELVARAEAGEEVVIARDGKPVVTLTPRPIERPAERRRLGMWNHIGESVPADAFLGPDPETACAIAEWEVRAVASMQSFEPVVGVDSETVADWIAHGRK